MTTFTFGEANGTTLETVDSKWAGDSTLLEVQSGFLQVVTANGATRSARYENGQGNAQSVQILRKAGPGLGSPNATNLRLQDNGTNSYDFRIGASYIEIYRNGVYQAGDLHGINTATTDATFKGKITAGGLVSAWVATGSVADAEISGSLVTSFTDGAPLTGGYPGIAIAADSTASDARIDDWTDGVSSGTAPAVKTLYHSRNANWF